MVKSIKSKYKSKKIPTESQSQIALFDRCRYHAILKDYLMAIPNGGKRHVVTAVRLKREGVKAGVFDTLLAYPVGIYHGLWLELKREKPGKSIISDAQKSFAKRQSKVGYACSIAYGQEEAWTILIDYLDFSKDRFHMKQRIPVIGDNIFKV